MEETTTTMLDYTPELAEIIDGVKAIENIIAVTAILALLLACIAFFVWLGDKFIDV